MRTIRFEYRRLLRWISLTVSVPETISEMSQEQMISVSRYYLGQLEEDDFIHTFFNIPSRLIRQLQKFQKYKLIELVDYTRKEDNVCTDIIIREPDGRKHASCPLTMLRNTTFKQFMLIDTLFSSYAVNREDGILKQFLNAIYCYEQDEELDVDTAISMAVFFNWLFIKNMLSQRFPLLFPEENGNGNDASVVKWLDIFDSFVGEDVAHMYDYERMQAMDVLRIMNKRIKDYNDRKAKIK